MARQLSLAEFGLEDRTYTIEEWQEIEGRTGEKFEYHEGRLVSWRMMSGGSPEHSHIGGNLIGSIFKNLTASEKLATCNVYTSDLQLKVPDTAKYVYPDAAVVCGKPSFDTRIKTAVTNPVVVVEVLSPSSVRYDMGEKFDYYSRLPSLREYVLVAQDEYVVEVRSRAEAGGKWTYAFTKSLKDIVRLDALRVALPMAEVYRGIGPGEDDAEQGEAVPA